MKKAGKFILWILGIVAWLFILTMFWVIDTPTGNNSHQIILIITGICLAIYLWKNSGKKALEKENQELKAENQKLRQELAAQAARHAMEKTESREGR